ncbi:serine/threonine-protein kinase [Sphaerisporangium dianthi]|uniref:non-specific serine/threonine protein kinase n=1 Tax=Sphaerisporangium dianthi TaxID=1436120 RepID=A0ABV9CDZ0_9ACTN
MDGQSGAWRVPGYTEIRDLGSGGSGRVVMARYDADQTYVAIKYLSDELCADPGFVVRFRHEARLLELMDSPHAARFYEYIEHPGGAAIVMELVNGVSLRAMLRSEGPTGAEAALVLLKGALLGLAAAHASGVVHRDFKPENVVIEGGGDSKLIDFGIAVRSGDGVSGAGTPPYMAPEQWAGAPAGPSTDVYAATIVFFECLTGTRPFQSRNMAALARQHQSMPPPVEQVPAPLRGLIERGMAKRAAERPATAEAFLAELEDVALQAYGPDWEDKGRRRLAALAGLLALLFPLADEMPGASTSLGETEFGGARRGLSKLSVKIAVGAVGLAVVAAVGAVLVGSLGDSTLQAQTTTTTPSAVPDTASGSPEPAIAESPTEAPSEEPTKQESPTAEPTADPPGNTAAAVPSAAARPTATKTSAKPTPKPSPKKPPKTLKPSPSPTKSGDPDPSDPKVDDTLPSGKPKPTPTPRPTQQNPPSPSPEPTRTVPSPTPTPTPRGEGDTPAPDTTPQRGPAGLLALGLVTTGAVPATLVLRQRMAGRHRRRR